jgi:oxygen-dependent protoporphyrinogen oxidase
MSTAEPYLVIGGGASGIAAADFLRQANRPVEVIEQSASLGGRIAPGELEGAPVDLGGKNIGRRYRLFREFARRHGDPSFEYFGINSSRLGPDGRLTTLDSTRRWRSVWQLWRRSAKRDLLRFAWLCARVASREGDGYLGGAYFDGLGRRRDERPISAYFSGAFCQAVIRPIVVRMNGAEPDEVFLGNFGSNLRSLLDTYDQPREGMRPLLAGFAARVPVRLGTAARSLVLEDGRVRAVEIERAGKRELRRCAGVVLAAPAPAAARLLEGVRPATARALRRVRYYPVMVIVARYRRPVFTPQVRAIVFRPDQPLSNAGAYGAQRLDTVRYTFSGRAAREAISGDPEALLRGAEALLGAHTPVRTDERLDFVARRFDDGLCAYAPHHADLRAALDESLHDVDGLALAGDYLRGASIEACFRSAHGAVETLLKGGVPASAKNPAA